MLTEILVLNCSKLGSSKIVYAGFKYFGKIIVDDSQMHQNALKKCGHDCMGACPVCDKFVANGFYPPSGSNLTEDEIEFVCAKIREARG
ncbi:hypothetical protein NO2_0171 [Candidatus Termititenax persephonae]|uniref:Uncharacterized protein n=1 Tax=Candidatus Termititenax persephonae TaxID=2218525 RepID=A0A388TFU7_9BACT|nr:hypothetical protein NO2_0171 [Candidatus Termititenax persephonae]